MAEKQQASIAIDEVVESASAGVLRALAARDISPQDFTRDNGFWVTWIIHAGGFPTGDPAELIPGHLQHKVKQSSG